MNLSLQVLYLSWTKKDSNMLSNDENMLLNPHCGLGVLVKWKDIKVEGPLGSNVARTLKWSHNHPSWQVSCWVSWLSNIIYARNFKRSLFQISLTGIRTYLCNPSYRGSTFPPKGRSHMAQWPIWVVLVRLVDIHYRLIPINLNLQVK